MFAEKEQPVHGLVEDREVQRLDEELADGVPAEVPEADLVGIGRDQNGFALVAGFAEFADQFDAVQSGELVIRDDEVDRLVAEPGQGFFRIRDGIDAE